MSGCEFCGSKIRSGADKCYVKGCIGYGLSITELDNERQAMIDFYGLSTYVQPKHTESR